MALDHHTKSKKAKFDSDSSVDRFSELPDGIVHHIFSFLDMNDMFRTLTLSKRCLELCFSSPCIYFASGTRHENNFINRYIFKLQKNSRNRNCFSSDQACDKHLCKKFKSFLDRYRSQQGNNEVYSFRLQWYQADCDCYTDGRSLIDASLHSLAQCKVRELSLDIDLTGGCTENNDFKLGGFKFLRVLEINLKHDTITLPSTILSCLEILSVNASNFNSSSCSIGRWISNYCPSLKKLSLVSVPGELRLVNNSLTDVTIATKWFHYISVSGENLEVLSLYFPIRAQDEDNTSLKVYAPNLQDLKWEGCLPKKIRFSEPVSLTEATFNNCQINKPSKYTLEPFVELLHCAVSAKVLHLDISMVKAMFIIYKDPIEFKDLHQLEIKNCSGDTNEGYHIPLMAYLMMGLPKLRFLTIDCNHNGGSSDLYWEDETRNKLRSIITKNNQKAKMYKNHLELCQVKELTIRLSAHSRKRSNGSLLVNYFLESIVGLERMTILCPPRFCNQLSALLEEVKFASSGVNVLTMVDR